MREEKLRKDLDRVGAVAYNAYMTAHANCTHEATKSARAACRKAAATTPALVRPTLRTGEVLFCEDCRPTNSRKIHDLNASPCPCGATYSDGQTKGARYIEVQG